MTRREAYGTGYFRRSPDPSSNRLKARKEWKWFHSDEGAGWNDLLIECRGLRIKTTVNGIPIADYDGTGVLDDENYKCRNVGTSGHYRAAVARQRRLHSVKDIYVKPARGKLP